VVIHQKHDQRAPGTLDLQAAAQPGGEHGGAVGVFAHILGTTGVVEDDREIERIGVLNLQEQLPIDFPSRIGLGDELVQHFHAAKRVLVRGVAVEKLVLDEAIERAELRQIVAEEPDSMHLAEDGRDVALALEDGLECLAIGFRVTELAVEVFPVRFYEFANGRAQVQAAELAMLEQPHHPAGILLENVGVGGINPSFPGDEAIEFLALFLAECQERSDAGVSLVFLLDLEALHQRAGMLIDIAGVPVVVPHEGLGAAEDAFLGIGESGGDDALQLESELVGGLVRMIVQLVADAVEEIVGFLEFAVGGGC